MALVTVTDFIREILSYQKLNGRFHVLKNFINEQCVHQDETTKEIAGNKLIRRAANGTAKVAAPVASDDIARKAEVDARETPTGAQEKVDALKTQIVNGTVVAGAATKINGYSISLVKKGTINIPKGESVSIDLGKLLKLSVVMVGRVYMGFQGYITPTWKIEYSDTSIGGSGNDILTITNPSPAAAAENVPYEVIEFIS
jgi:hypothetical protein